MPSPKMIIGVQFANSFGAHEGAWRMLGADPSGYANVDMLVKYAKIADRGGLEFIFMPDRPLLDADLADGLNRPGFRPLFPKV